MNFLKLIFIIVLSLVSVHSFSVESCGGDVACRELSTVPSGVRSLGDGNNSFIVRMSVTLKNISNVPQPVRVSLNDLTVSSRITLKYCEARNSACGSNSDCTNDNIVEGPQCVSPYYCEDKYSSGDNDNAKPDSPAANTTVNNSCDRLCSKTIKTNCRVSDSANSLLIRNRGVNTISYHNTGVEVLTTASQQQLPATFVAKNGDSNSIQAYTNKWNRHPNINNSFSTYLSLFDADSKQSVSFSKKTLKPKEVRVFSHNLYCYLTSSILYCYLNDIGTGTRPAMIRVCGDDDLRPIPCITSLHASSKMSITVGVFENKGAISGSYSIDIDSSNGNEAGSSIQLNGGRPF